MLVSRGRGQEPETGQKNNSGDIFGSVDCVRAADITRGQEHSVREKWRGWRRGKRGPAERRQTDVVFLMKTMEFFNGTQN